MVRESRNITESPIGLYVTDASNFSGLRPETSHIKETGSVERFTPILDLFNPSGKPELRFASSSGFAQNDIRTDNETDPTRRLDESIRSVKTLSTHANDLFLGGVQIVLNFTKHTVTIIDPLGISKKFVSLESKRFEDYKGCLVFVTIRSLNNPEFMERGSDGRDYLTRIADALPGNDPDKEKEIRDICGYVSWYFKSTKGVDRATMSRTVKVVSVAMIDETELTRRGEPVEIYVRNKQILITTANLDNPIVHPIYTGVGMDDQVVLEALREHGVSCYIVDNKDLLSPRYMNFAGRVFEIPKIKDLNQPEGLHVVSISKDTPLNTDNITKLEDIDSSPYIYKSHEAALTGADMKAQYTEKMDMLRQKLTYDAQQQKLEFDRREEEFKLEQRRREAEFKEEERRKDAEHEHALKALNKSLEETKAKGAERKWEMDDIAMERKNHYEHMKYERDTTIETLKTVGAVAAVGLTIYTVYSKFNK